MVGGVDHMGLWGGGTLSQSRGIGEDRMVERGPVTGVLVVDDLRAFRVAVRRVLAHTDDFEMLGEAASGDEAVRLSADLRPAAILMDIGLNGESGIDVTRRVLEVDPAVTVILVSTYAVDDLPAEASECGARAYLHKEDLAAPVLRDLLGAKDSSTGVVFR